MTGPRLLSREERRMLADALRMLAAEARKARSRALTDPRLVCNQAVTAHVDALAVRASSADRLAAEITELEVRLERMES